MSAAPFLIGQPARVFIFAALVAAFAGQKSSFITVEK
jgi:hypothetical protein